jgi:hypothetical protein
MQHPNSSDHARHDATLIAGHAAGDLTDTERARADAVLGACDDCTELRRDLVAIAAATRSVPAPATLARDLRLAPEQAERLRRGSWLRGFLRPFGAAGSPIRPMATAFTSLGVVGLVVGITLSSGAGLAGSPASGQGFDREIVPAPAATGGAAAEDPHALTEGGGPIVPTVVASDGGLYPVSQASGDAYAQYATGGPIRDGAYGLRTAVPKSVEPAATEAALGAVDKASQTQSGNERAIALLPTPPNLLIAGSLALLGIGLLLFGLRSASRRVR